MSTSADYLKTLRRIPDDIVLAIAAQDFDPGDSSRCLCGWAVRESVARAVGIDPTAVDIDALDQTVRGECMTRFGGTYLEWSALYGGVCTSEMAYVEAALADRLDEIVA